MLEDCFNFVVLFCFCWGTRLLWAFQMFSETIFHRRNAVSFLLPHCNVAMVVSPHGDVAVLAYTARDS
jgi:hypothetical protein